MILTPTSVEHALAAFLLVLWPAWSALRGGASMRALERHPERKLSEYWTTIVTQWTFTAVILWLWWRAGRPWPALGLGLDVTPGAAIAVGLTAALAWFLAPRYLRLRRDRVFYLLSGALWVPMVLHAMVDLFQFAAVRTALAGRAEPAVAGDTGEI